jgi:hypothetical protein
MVKPDKPKYESQSYVARHVPLVFLEHERCRLTRRSAAYSPSRYSLTICMTALHCLGSRRGSCSYPANTTEGPNASRHGLKEGRVSNKSSSSRSQAGTLVVVPAALDALVRILFKITNAAGAMISITSLRASKSGTSGITVPRAISASIKPRAPVPSSSYHARSSGSEEPEESTSASTIGNASP